MLRKKTEKLHDGLVEAVQKRIKEFSTVNQIKDFPARVRVKSQNGGRVEQPCPGLLTLAYS
jgi:hypothetical protein